MTSPLVLLVGGRLASGKDTFADHLAEKHGFVKLGMSDVLAEALYRLNPWINVGIRAVRLEWNGEEHTYPTFLRYQELVDHDGYVEAKKNPEVRRLLQQLGTEVGRQLLGQDIWVQGAARRIDAELQAGHSVAITGIRYENELGLEDYIKQPSIVTSVWIERAQEIDATAAAHSSEQLGPDGFEYIVNNEDGLSELYGLADELLVEIEDDFS